MTYRIGFVGWCALSLVVGGVACVGDDPIGGGEGLADAGPPSTPSDASTPSPLPPDADPCSTADTCDDAALVHCGERTACDFGCRQGDAGAPRCATFEPIGPLTAADLTTGGLGDLVLEGTKINFQTGEILRGETVVRQASDLAQPELKNGVRFWRTSEAFVIQAQNIVLSGSGLDWRSSSPDQAPLPLILAANDDVRVETMLRLPCGFLGGGIGGPHLDVTDSRVGSGVSSRPAGGALGGGGGGRHGGSGGWGGTGRTPTTFIPGGATVPGLLDFVLLGGPGGGAGGGYGQDPGGGSYVASSAGGAGGGALQLVAGRSIVFGGGEVGINAGGCGGHGNDSPETLNRNFAGAGGGAGGFILLEAPVIAGAGPVILAANGGGGGGRGSGLDGALSDVPAAGAPAGACVEAGGAGGAGASADAKQGQDVASPIPTACTSGRGGGGGGGSAGRIAIYTLGGTGPEGTGFVMSPSVGAAFRLGTLTAEP